MFYTKMSLVLKKEIYMKNSVKYLALGLSAFIIGMSVNSYAMSDVPGKIAVVDVQKVVASSAQVKALKTDREAKIKDLANFVTTARAAVAKETNAAKKKELENKYNKELNAKRDAIQKDYAKKLASVDQNISATIAQKAKAANYDIVLAKGVVLYGGSDITNEIAKSVK